MVKKNILEVKSLVKTYKKGNILTKAVKGISFEVKEGEFIALSGHSGSGKSTTFHQIALLDNPNSGSILFDGEDVLAYTNLEKSNFRLNKIGYVFQQYGLLSELTAIENVCLPLMVQDINYKELFKKAELILSEMNLLKRKNHYPSELSGGEQQRVSVARAIIKNPRIILADEPTANLDYESGHKIMEILKNLNKRNKTSIFVVNHELEFEKYFDRIIYLKDGIIDKIKINKDKK